MLTLSLVRSVLLAASVEHLLTMHGCAVDQPAGTGLSYASTDRYLTELTDVRIRTPPIDRPNVRLTPSIQLGCKAFRAIHA